MNSKKIQILFQLFGALLILLAVFAFLNKGSVASLLSGGISGILILVAVYFWKKESPFGVWGVSALTLILTLSFTSRAISTGKGLPIFLGSVSFVLFILTLVLKFQRKS